MIALQAARALGLLCVCLVGSSAFVHTSTKTSFKPALRPTSLCHVPPNRFFAGQSSILPCLGDKRAFRRGQAATRFSASAGSFGRAGGRLIVASATAAATNKIQLAISTFMGYGILVGSLFLQMPQIIKIISSRSALGISRLSRYAEVPINSSAVIYHHLKALPFSTYGENVAVLAQNILIVGLVWIWQVPRVKISEVLLVSVAFVLLCAVQLSLPPSLYPVLIYMNLPLVFSSCVPQIIVNYKQKHTGQLAILSYFLKLLGCTIRIFTTITQIGFDPGLLSNYGFGAMMNFIIVLQGIVYSKETERVRDEEKLKRMTAATGPVVAEGQEMLNTPGGVPTGMRKSEDAM